MFSDHLSVAYELHKLMMQQTAMMVISQSIL